jgi:hypothetical protein
MKNTVLLFALLLCGCASHYQVNTIRTSDSDYGTIKSNVSTGETWWMHNGSWTKIQDSQTIPKSHYEISVVSLNNDWGAIRIDAKTGKSWRASSGKWIEITN